MENVTAPAPRLHRSLPHNPSFPGRQSNGATTTHSGPNAAIQHRQAAAIQTIPICAHIRTACQTAHRR